MRIMILGNSDFEGLTDKARFIVVYALIALAFVVNVSALADFNGSSVQLPVVLMSIYYWAIYRPALMPVWLVFVIGVLIDSMTMLPLGFSALTLLVIQKFIMGQRRFLMAQNFIVLWLGFGLVNAFSFAVLYFAYFVIGVNDGDIMGILVSYAISFLVFPVVFLVLYLAHRMLPSLEAQRSFRLHRPKKS